MDTVPLYIDMFLFGIISKATPDSCSRYDRTWIGVNSGAVFLGRSNTLRTVISDPDGDFLTFTLSDATGGALPSWLEFNPQSMLLSGAAPQTDQEVHLLVTGEGQNERSFVDLRRWMEHLLFFSSSWQQH